MHGVLILQIVVHQVLHEICAFILYSFSGDAGICDLYKIMDKN